jgi:hypothetical protein
MKRVSRIVSLVILFVTLAVSVYIFLTGATGVVVNLIPSALILILITLSFIDQVPKSK